VEVVGVGIGRKGKEGMIEVEVEGVVVGGLEVTLMEGMVKYKGMIEELLKKELLEDNSNWLGGMKIVSKNVGLKKEAGMKTSKMRDVLTSVKA
jgi:hypothetical protein